MFKLLFKDEIVVLSSKVVAISTFATSPIMFILSFLASSLWSAALILHGLADDADHHTIIADQIKEEEDGNEIQCAVCLSEVTKGETYKVLPKCNHGYHVPCIDAWLQTNPTCPICRSEVPTKSSRQKCIFYVLLSCLRSFLEGFCKWFLGISTDPIEDGHYFF